MSGWVQGLDTPVRGPTDPNASPRPVALDGKTLRGSLRRYQAAVPLLAALDQQTGCVLSQMPVDGKTNERKAALTLLKGMVLRGRVITGDAMSCQREVGQAVLDGGGDYFVVVKANQPTLRQDIVAAFGPPFSPSGAAAPA